MDSNKNAVIAPALFNVQPRNAGDLAVELLPNVFSKPENQLKNVSLNRRKRSAILALLVLNANLVTALAANVSPLAALKNLSHVDSRRNVILATHHLNVPPRVAQDLEMVSLTNVSSKPWLLWRNVSQNQRMNSAKLVLLVLTVNLISASAANVSPPVA